MKNKKVKGFKFVDYIYSSNIGTTKEFISIPIDDTVTDVYIKTPKNWKCKRKGCSTKIKHKHGTYTCLK